MCDKMPVGLAGVHSALLKTDSVAQFLRELALLSATAVAQGLSGGMWLGERGRSAITTASSDPLAAAADEEQYQAGDGPALYALRHGLPALVDDTTSPDHRWPRFCARAAAIGLRSCYALPLTAEDQRAGALILYSREPFAFGPRETARAAAFAGHAGDALMLALRMNASAELNDQLRSSIVSRAIIDQAIGVIMATQHCSQDRALSLLKSVSQNANVKLRDLAADIITKVSGEPPRPGSPFEDG